MWLSAFGGATAHPFSALLPWMLLSLQLRRPVSSGIPCSVSDSALLCHGSVISARLCADHCYLVLIPDAAFWPLVVSTAYRAFWCAPLLGASLSVAPELVCVSDFADVAFWPLEVLTSHTCALLLWVPLSRPLRRPVLSGSYARCGLLAIGSVHGIPSVLVCPFEVAFGMLSDGLRDWLSLLRCRFPEFDQSSI